MDQFFSKDSPTSPSARYNMIDATYRAELRELNEINYARFEAKLEQRTTEIESRMDAGFERLRAEMIKWSFLFWMGMVVTVFVSRFIQP